MSSQKVAYGSPTAVTITVGALAQGAARQGAAVDNTTNLFLDALLTVKIKAPTGSPSNPLLVNVYVAGSLDGTNWPGEGSGNPDGVTGLDAAITLESPTNLILLAQLSIPTGTNTYVSEPVSVASAFNGVLPPYWTIVIENQTGGALQTGSTASYSGVYTTAV